MSSCEKTLQSKDLEALLAGGEQLATQRADAFDQICSSRKLVLFGAGGLGRKLLIGLRSNGVEPVAFSDNNSAIWGAQIDGIPVVAPQDAARLFGSDGVFVVSIWRAGGGHRFEHTATQLRSLGCERVVNFIPLMWKFPETFLPYYCLERPELLIQQAQLITDAFELWHDDVSRREYLAQVRFRLTGDVSGLPSPAIGEQYFPRDVLQLSSQEVFVDCGAFDGDVIKVLFRLSPDFAGHVYALEPDPENYDKLCDYLKSLPEQLQERVMASKLGAGARRENLRFSPERGAGSAIDTEGSLVIQVVSLDEHLQGEHAPTFIKMDIEGAEPDALAGASALIATHRPLLGISSYHLPDHLWKIPLQIASQAEQYQFSLRSHNEEGWDLVTYAVPPGRVR